MKKVQHTSEFPFGIYWWTLKNPKNQNFEKRKKKEKKKYWRYHHFTHVYQKPQSGTVPEIRSDTIQFCHSRPFFAIYPPPPPPHLSFLTLEKPKFWKKEKSIWRCHHFKLVQQKTQSNDACLLRYGVWQTFYHFVILGHFLLF